MLSCRSHHHRFPFRRPRHAAASHASSHAVHRGFAFLTLVALVLLAAPLSAQAPAGYYDTVDASNAVTLRQTLHEAIDDHTWFPYTDSATDTWNIVNLADEDPNNMNNIIDVYKNASYEKIPGGVGAYNREHTWPRSYGFPNLVDFNYPFTDCHHLFAADAGYNSARSNKPFRQCDAGCEEWTTDVNDGRGGGSGVYPGNSNWTTGDFTQGTWETWDGRKGDVARAILYMDIRYEGDNHGVTGHFEPDLIVTDNEALIDGSRTGSNETVAYMGMRTVLLQWHRQDPPDSREMWRNDVVFSFQGNRNPFIDHPEWVDCLYDDLCTLDTDPPAAPAGLMASPLNGGVELTWLANGEGDLAGYHVYRGTVSGGPFSRVSTSLVTATEFTDTAVTNGTTYFYVVTAQDLAGNESADSNEVSATPDGTLPDTTAPATPTGLTATGADGQVSLGWDANGEADLAGYNLLRATSSGGPYNPLNGTPVTSESFLDTTVTNGTTYFYVVTAVDTSGNESGASAEASATPLAPNAGGVILSEVLYDVSSTDDGWEWVELFNSGSTTVDLSGFCLANGGTDYTYSQVQLSGLVAPGETFVVGGPNVGATNANPVFDQVFNFNPDFQNSGTAGDAVGLFDTPCVQVGPASVPVDAVIYGPNNNNGLLDETGVANPPEVGDAAPDSSLERVDLAGNWQIQSAPTPNTTPLGAPPPPGNTAPTVTITAPADGSGFDAGTAVTFTATATDAEDGDLSAAIAWSSDRDGALGTGSSVTTSGLSLGTHVITASVTDSGGLAATDTVNVTVNAVGGPVTVTFTSIGGEDGWVLEDRETSNDGGRDQSNGSGADALRAGDSNRNQQYKAVVSFDTSSIPAGATVTAVTLRLRRGTVNGTNPFTTHGTAWVDVHTGGLGGDPQLDKTDFEAAATVPRSASLSNAASDGAWSEGTLDATGMAAVNTAGRTQLRVHFDLDDNDDRDNDYIGYFSGDDADPANHPQLVVTYQP